MKKSPKVKSISIQQRLWDWCAQICLPASVYKKKYRKEAKTLWVYTYILHIKYNILYKYSCPLNQPPSVRHSRISTQFHCLLQQIVRYQRFVTFVQVPIWRKWPAATVALNDNITHDTGPLPDAQCLSISQIYPRHHPRQTDMQFLPARFSLAKSASR